MDGENCLDGFWTRIACTYRFRMAPSSALNIFGGRYDKSLLSRYLIQERSKSSSGVPQTLQYKSLVSDRDVLHNVGTYRYCNPVNSSKIPGGSVDSSLSQRYLQTYDNRSSRAPLTAEARLNSLPMTDIRTHAFDLIDDIQTFQRIELGNEYDLMWESPSPLF